VKIKVIAADDHPFVLLGIEAMLKQSADLELVGQVDNGASLVDLLRVTPCDVLICDLSMPDESGALGDGLPLVRRLLREWPELRIVILTSATNAAVLHTLMREGVKGIVGKAESMDVLAPAVREVASGRVYAGKVLADGTGASAPCGRKPSQRLSPRESEVLSLFVDGLSVVEIARRLGRDVRTVSRQKRDAMAKLGVSSDPGLLVFVHAQGLD